MAPPLTSAALGMKGLQLRRAPLTDGGPVSESLYRLFFIGKTLLEPTGFCRNSHPSATSLSTREVIDVLKKRRTCFGARTVLVGVDMRDFRA